MRQWFEKDRRSFLGAIVGGVIGVIGCLVALASTAGVGLVTSLWPAFKKSGGDDSGEAGGTDGMIAIAPLSLVPEDGTPRSFPVIADRVDAWTVAKDQVVGGVFLRREGDEIIAMTVICPHAGCTIGIKATPEGSEYFCPCHNATFDLAGDVVGASPSPRPMDTLDVAVVDGMVMVRYQNFKLGGTTKEVVS